MPLLGTHVSIAGGLEKSIERGEELACDSIQIFTKNQRQWDAFELNPNQIHTFKQTWKESNIKSIVVHNSYLINLASPDKTLQSKSQTAFFDEIKRIEMLDIPILIFHPGAYTSSNKRSSIQTIGESINLSIEHILKKAYLCIENTAGAGTQIGGDMEDLFSIIELVDKKEHIGICIDTSHAFQAGYDLRKQEIYDSFIHNIEKSIGLDKLKAFHLNDSMTKLQSHIDRHANIGEGHLGLAPFQYLVNDKRFTNIPMILETPKIDNGDKRNLELLHSLINF